MNCLRRGLKVKPTTKRPETKFRVEGKALCIGGPWDGRLVELPKHGTIVIEDEQTTVYRLVHITVGAYGASQRGRHRISLLVRDGWKLIEALRLLVSDYADTRRS